MKKELVTQKPLKKNQSIIGYYPPILMDIPMYDPKTGEPNPHYEKLTGKKNPLAEIRKSGESKSMLLPPNFSPKTKNRFVVKFPEEMDIKPFIISNVILPSVKHQRFTLLGLNFKTNTYISDFHIEMIDCISRNNIKTINKLFLDEKKFNLEIEMQDPTGVVYEKVVLSGCFISMIDFGVLNYDDASLLKYKLTLKTNKLEIL